MTADFFKNDHFGKLKGDSPLALIRNMLKMENIGVIRIGGWTRKLPATADATPKSTYELPKLDKGEKEYGAFPWKSFRTISLDRFDEQLPFRVAHMKEEVQNSKTVNSTHFEWGVPTIQEVSSRQILALDMLGFLQDDMIQESVQEMFKIFRDIDGRMDGLAAHVFNTGNSYHIYLNKTTNTYSPTNWFTFALNRVPYVDTSWLEMAQMDQTMNGCLRLSETFHRPRPYLVQTIAF